MERIALSTGVSLDVQIEGPQDAPALIFLHGFPESHRTWRHQIPHFSDRYRCIAPDQRGYCGSDKPKGVEHYTPEHLTGDIFALADALGIERFTLVGHDWGGAIGWGAAVLGQMQGRVEGLVIMNAPHPVLFQRLLYTSPEQREASQYIRAFRDPANDALVREHGLIGLLLKVVRWDSSPALESEERDRLLKDWQDRDAAFAMLNWYRATQLVVPEPDAPYGLPAEGALPDLPAITVPTQVIWAEDDQALPPINLQGLESYVTDLHIETIADCGHFVPWEAPQAVNAAMDRFLAENMAAV